jgi:hypothetical protein
VSTKISAIIKTDLHITQKDYLYYLPLVVPATTNDQMETRL